MKNYTTTAALLIFTTAVPLFSQILETESARLEEAHHFKMYAAYEHQFSSDGIEGAVPLAFEYGVLNNLEVLVEPVLYAGIFPKTGSKANGIGDLELTLTYNFLPEKRVAPALAIAGEVKIPTARNTLIGTGKADYAFYAIASKALEKCDLHANFAYTIMGSPAGVKLQNTYSGSIAAEYHLNRAVDLQAEFFAGSASLPEGDGKTSSDNESVVIPEAAGGEAFGTIGVGWHITPIVELSSGVSYDNNRAVLIISGFTVNL